MMNTLYKKSLVISILLILPFVSSVNVGLADAQNMAGDSAASRSFRCSFKPLL
jgi:hypothetical protein